ncbi:hypothetical protein PF005_g32331 [Phytophthora fragariae]|nr:hypothetical protein PF003_g3317 [Phytophthora fragariae]KAE9158721.1 hypothetical protein PF005_g32331 [Phytophthora fragariae]
MFAHRVVLATAGPFFSALFTSGMGDTILSELHAANRLELQEVVKVCYKQLMLEFSVHNCVEIYTCCDQLQTRAATR